MFKSGAKTEVAFWGVGREERKHCTDSPVCVRKWR